MAASILARATIPSSEVEPVHCGDGVEAQAVRIHLANDSLVVYNIYKPPPIRLEATDAVNRLQLKDTILNKGPDTMSPDYSTPAPWESPSTVFNILQTGTRKADCNPHELRQVAERNMKALTPHIVYSVLHTRFRRDHQYEGRSSLHYRRR
ncbi:hypothetical protein Hamer_G006760 [Homarus americanus]|uniref:Uncharacterized protein n=1 Tax=Homarus americanus TaxID=6706 RepID=A0A8J5JGE3_HOMAM|nr:hypothetical protein Hamer_G006760 [Homarus americanus]